MTDIRGFSRIILDGGESQAAALMRAYERIVRTALPTQTVEVDHIGDSFHLVFPSPSQAVNTAAAIADALQRHNEANPDLKLPVAIGIDTGEGVSEGDHFVGSAPVLASHLCHRAAPGQILVSEAVFALLRTAKPGTCVTWAYGNPRGVTRFTSTKRARRTPGPGRRRSSDS